jgi:hypothetical protein
VSVFIPIAEGGFLRTVASRLTARLWGFALKALDTPAGAVASAGAAAGWIVALGAAAGVAVAYYLAARLGLALLAAPSDVAVFWPASGLAVGILMLSNRRSWAAIAIGVLAGTLQKRLDVAVAGLL